MSARSALRVIGVIECLTLLVLLANLVTAHRPEISSVAGPVHGLCYTAAIIAAALVSGGRHRVWLLALIPGIGGLLASKAAS
jgi:hypothetical protein